MEITRRTPEMTFLKTIGSTDMITLNRSEADVTPEQGMVHFGFIVGTRSIRRGVADDRGERHPDCFRPRHTGSGRYVFISDPDGYTLELFECLLPPYEEPQ